MQPVKSEEAISRILKETFAIRNSHVGSLTRAIVLEGVTIERGATVHFVRKRNGIQSSLQASTAAEYKPFDAIIHFGPTVGNEPRSTAHLESKGVDGFRVSRLKLASPFGVRRREFTLGNICRA